MQDEAIGAAASTSAREIVAVAWCEEFLKLSRISRAPIFPNLLFEVRQIERSRVRLDFVDALAYPLLVNQCRQAPTTDRPARSLNLQGRWGPRQQDTMSLDRPGRRKGRLGCYDSDYLRDLVSV